MTKGMIFLCIGVLLLVQTQDEPLFFRHEADRNVVRRIGLAQQLDNKGTRGIRDRQHVMPSQGGPWRAVQPNVSRATRRWFNRKSIASEQGGAATLVRRGDPNRGPIRRHTSHVPRSRTSPSANCRMNRQWKAAPMRTAM